MTVITQRMEIPEPVQKLIELVVRNDEGGFRLAPIDKNDQDGGWTFGGITSSLYNKCYTQEDQRPIDVKTIEQIVMADKMQHLIDDCMQIYFQVFCIPLVHVTNEPGLNRDISAMELSCFINIGQEKFMEIYRQAHNMSGLYKDNFLKQWRQYYCHLVGANSQAWHDWGVALETLIDKTMEYPSSSDEYDELQNKKPKTLRSKYLSGWIARVDKYV